MKRRVGCCSVLLALAASMVDGCIPYGVGSTARTVKPNQTRYSVTTYVLPRDLGLQKFPHAPVFVGADIEVRRGIDYKSDIGVRFAGVEGIIVSYKRQLTNPERTRGPEVSAMVGGGFITMLPFGELEGTLIVSDREEGRFTPYGGLRAAYTSPMTTGVTRRPLTYGGFGGLRAGSPDAGVFVELGVFRDKSTLVPSTKNVAIVPSITITTGFLTQLFDALTGARR